MVASLIKFSDAVILRLQAESEGDHLDVAAEQWQPLTVFPSSSELDLQRLENRSWVASQSASGDDLGELFSLTKSLVMHACTASDGNETIRLKQQDGQCYFKLSERIAKQIADHPSRCVLFGVYLKPLTNDAISDDELAAALDRVNSQYSQALTWLAQ